MKIKIDIDCTPEEARQFMGLPDVSHLHEQWMEKMAAMIQSGDGADMWQIWSQMGMQGVEQWQKFTASFDDATPAPKGKKK
jgi:ABC-type glycerol-3-phosphate transport system substrate-binding protein